MTASSNVDKNTDRKNSKPLMEKRRRARINQSLAVLKTLIVDTQKVEGQKHKLEKADILELTVDHLQRVKRSDEQKFIQGFEECFSEATRFLEKTEMDSTMVDKLTDHLKKFQNNLDLSSVLNEDKNMTLTTVSESNSSGVEDNPVKLLPFPSSQSSEASSTPFPLNVPRYRTETSISSRGRKAPSSTHSRSSSCLSPSFSNDSNNNNFAPEVDPFRHHTPEQGYPHSGSVESFDRIRPSPDSTSTRPPLITENAYALNLSTHDNNSSFNYANPTSTGHDDVEAMEEDQSLDFSRPLNLCTYSNSGLRVSEVWRPYK